MLIYFLQEMKLDKPRKSTLKKDPDSSRGQMSLSPAKGETRIVFSSMTGLLFVKPPSQ